MFTGIVEETGVVERITRRAGNVGLAVRAKICGRGLKAGDSLAVNGCCLTVVRIATRSRGRLVHFDLLQETWRRTNFSVARRGSLVNLERALRVDDRWSGHFVTGHIDGVGEIVRWERAGHDHLLEIAAPREIMRHIVHKGSVAVDGISLTVAAVSRRSFRIWIIPHTCRVTAMRERQAGDLVNVETDILGKYVERFISLAAVAR